jgi:hypothetical protein
VSNFIVSIKKYASDLQTCLAVRKIEKDVETKDMCLQSLVNSESLNQTKLSYKIDTGLKTVATSILQFGEVVVESKPCEFTFLRKKDKQAQMMVADLSPPMSADSEKKENNEDTCPWFLRLSLFASQLNMFAGLMNTFLC